MFQHYLLKESQEYFFKANGRPQLQSQKELMLYNLYRLLQIPDPNIDLLSNVYYEDPGNFYTDQALEVVL